MSWLAIASLLTPPVLATIALVFFVLGSGDDRFRSVNRLLGVSTLLIALTVFCLYLRLQLPAPWNYYTTLLICGLPVMAFCLEIIALKTWNGDQPLESVWIAGGSGFCFFLLGLYTGTGSESDVIPLLSRVATVLLGGVILAALLQKLSSNDFALWGAFTCNFVITAAILASIPVSLLVEPSSLNIKNVSSVQFQNSVTAFTTWGLLLPFALAGKSIFYVFALTRKKKVELAAGTFIDAYTELYNAKGFFTVADQYFHTIRNFSKPASVAVCEFSIDTDFSKRQFRGVSLKAIIPTVAAGIRDTDILASYGMDKLVILFPGIGSDKAKAICESFQNQVLRNCRNEQVQASKVNICFGVTSMYRSDSNVSDLVMRAENALKVAQSHGPHLSVAC